MKWAFAIQKKIRLAIALAVLMLCIILFSLFESYNTTRIARSIKSIYDDRLIPAADLYILSDHIQDKRNLLSDHLFLHTGQNNFKEQSAGIDKNLDSLIGKYQKTYLVAAESAYLARLKQHLQDLKGRERHVDALRAKDPEEARRYYTYNMLPVYRALSLDLRKLISVQTEVGKELLDESVRSRSSSEMLSSLQLVISIILGIMIIVLVMTNKQMPVKQENYHLN